MPRVSSERRAHSPEREPEPQPRARADAFFSVAELDALAAVVSAGVERDEALLSLVRCRWSARLAIEELADEQLRAEAALAPADMQGPPRQPASQRAAVGGAVGGSLARSPTPAALQPAAVDAGYIVIRTPSPNRARRGWHQCDWGALMARLGVPRTDWPQRKAGYYVRLYRSRSDAELHWTRQGLLLPIPVNP